MTNWKERLEKVLSIAFPVKKREIAILLGVLFLLWFFSHLTQDNQSFSRLKKPVFGDKEQEVNLTYQYRGKHHFSEDIAILLPVQTAGEEEALKLLDKVAEQIVENTILPQLQTNIKKLELPKSRQEVTIQYRVLPEGVWTKEGEWNYFALFSQKEEVEIEIILDLKYLDKSKSKHFKKTLSADDFSESYVKSLLHRQIQEQLQKQLMTENTELVLPKAFQGGELDWRSVQTNIGFVQFLGFMLFSVLFFSGLSRLADRERREKIKKRYLRDFTQMLHRLVLLLRSGKSPYSALLELSCDTDGYGQEFAAAMEKCHNLLYHQESFDKSLDVIYQDCPHSEIEQFQKLMKLADQKGDEWSILYLEQLRDDMFGQRLRQANEMMQKMSSRFVFPMVLFLIIIIILTIFPTFQSGF